MDELLLRSYETFSEIPDGKLVVTEKSNLMYVRIGRFAFIAREFVDSIINEKSNTIYKISYMNVKNHEKILDMEIMIGEEKKVLNKKEDIEITPLSKLLKVKGNRCALLSLNDIDSLLEFKEEFIPGKKISII